MDESNGIFHRHAYGYNHENCRHGGAPSSYRMHDSELVFSELKLESGHCILDLGCGKGDYAIQAAQKVGETGIVLALDRSEYAIEGLRAEADTLGLKNIKAFVADITVPLTFQNNCVDICFVSTVLHIFDLNKIGETLFGEIRRVLKPDGRLAVIEVKKDNRTFGPPMHMRHSPEYLEQSVIKYGFEKISMTDLGISYLIQFGIK